MLRKLSTLLESIAGTRTADTDHESLLKLAAAVLLVEVMMADHHIADAERAKLAQSIQRFLGVNYDESLKLIKQAEEKHDELVSLHEITKVINTHYQPPQKIALIGHMWQMAYADQQLDKYEEHLIRKVADLLYVSHKDYIKTKHQAQGEK